MDELRGETWNFTSPKLQDNYSCPGFMNSSAPYLLGAGNITEDIFNAVLNKDFIPDSIIDLLELNDTSAFFQALSGNWTEVVNENAAWAALSIGGLSLLLVLFFIALISMCCLSCCSGKNYSKSSDNFCLCGLIPVSLTLVAVCALGGVWYAFATSTLIKQPAQIIDDVNGNIINDAKIFGQNTLEQAKYLANNNTNEFTEDIDSAIDSAMAKINDTAYDIKDQVKLAEAETIIDFILNRTTEFAITELPQLKNDTQDLLSEFTNTKTLLSKAVNDLAGIQSIPQDLKTSLTAFETTIDGLDVDSINSAINVIDIPQGDLDQIKAIDDLVKNADKLLGNFSSQFNTDDLIQFKQEIDQIKGDIQLKVGNLTDTIQTDFLDQIEPIKVPDFINQISDYYPFHVSMIPAYIAGLSLLFFLMAMVIGPLGSAEGGARKCSSCFLSFSFAIYGIFALLILILTSVAFVLGSVGTYTCWTLDGETNIVDTLNKLINEQIHNANVTINTTDILENCRMENAGLYQALNLSTAFDPYLDNLTNWQDTYDITEKLDEIRREVNQTLEDVKTQFVINDAQKNTALNIASQIDDNTEKVLTLLESLNLTSTVDGFSDTLSKIEKLVESFPIALDDFQNLNSSLINLVSKTDILTQHVTQALADVKYNNQTTTDTVKEIFDLAQNASDYINGNGSTMVIDVTNETLNSFTDLGDQFVNFALTLVRKDFGKCKPLADIYDAFKAIGCGRVVASINAVWLGLGTITLGWTLLILVGLGVKSILARRIYRPAYQSRTRVSSQRASAPPQGIELHHLNGQQGKPSGSRGLTRQLTGNPHNVAKQYISGMENRDWKQ